MAARLTKRLSLVGNHSSQTWLAKLYEFKIDHRTDKFDVRKILRALKLVAINLLVLFLLIEIGSVGVYFLKTGEFFYTRTSGRPDAGNAQLNAGLPAAANNPSLLFQLHPYFGFVNRPNGAPGTASNRLGFWSRHDYPFKKTAKNQFVIGIFGGSVAANLYFDELKSHALASALKRAPYLQDKEIIFLCFATGAYKQPQQLLLLSYFLSIGQELDLVVNIDGFNETALSYMNNKAGMETSMPANFLISPLADLANKDFSGPIVPTLELMLTRNKIQESQTRLAACRLATCYTFRWMQEKLLVSHYEEELRALSDARSKEKGDTLVHLDRIDEPLNDTEVVSRLAEEWAQSSLMMSHLLAPRNVPYLHIVQPNQYYPTQRRFSKEETEIAIFAASPFREGVSKGYPELLSRVPKLRAAGVNVFDGTKTLDQVEGAVYLDNCCHYNKRGNEVFGSYIAEAMIMLLTRPASDSKPKPSTDLLKDR